MEYYLSAGGKKKVTLAEALARSNWHDKKQPPVKSEPKKPAKRKKDKYDA